MSTYLIFGLLIALMLTGMPISIALGLTVLTFLFTMTQVPLHAVALKLFTGIERFEIMAIPFFILAGSFLTRGGVALRMINFATSLVGHWYGGLGLAGVVACALFASVCGSSPATVVAIGSIVLPAMQKQGFPKKFGAGVIATSGALGILMLPSIVKVIYAVSTNTSIGALFVAGVLPGLVLTAMLGATTWYIARKNDYPRLARASWRARIKAFRESIWGLFLVVVVIGGIYSGIFTATEAAAMSAVYAFFVAVFVYKDMSLKEAPRSLLEAANLSAMLLYIITNAVLFSFLMTSENIPQMMAEWLLNKGLGPDRVPADGQRAAAARGQRDGAFLHRADHGADPVPGRHEARNRPGSLRHHDRRQHGDRALPSARRLESLCRERHHQDGDHRAHGRGVAVAAHDAGISGARDLLAGAVPVVAESAGDDVSG